MNKKQLQQKADNLRKQMGGTVFAFPVKEEDPFSAYAVVMFAGNKYHVYPKASNISEAAVGIATITKLMKESGYNFDYEKDVRFISYAAQINAPDVTMRRLRGKERI